MADNQASGEQIMTQIQDRSDIYAPANDVQREEMLLEEQRRMARDESRSAVLRIVHELGATAADGVPVYRVTRLIQERYPRVGEYQARLAFAELAREGAVGWDATRDRATVKD